MTPVGKVADTITAVTKLLTKWLDGTKGRRTRKALKNAQLFINRVEKVYDIDGDKQLLKYKRNFFNSVTTN